MLESERAHRFVWQAYREHESLKSLSVAGMFMQMLEGELLTQPEEMSLAAFAAWSEVSTDDCGHLRYNHDLLRRMIAMARIFLCHASEDKPQVREVYQRLGALGFEPWLDEVEILPGQD